MPVTNLPPSIKLPDEVDIIWNHTRVCGWPCKVCCVAANQVRGTQLVSADLQSWQSLNRDDRENKFAAGQRMLQERGDELFLEQKLAVLHNLDGLKVKVDISGGDALITPDGLPLLKAASQMLGRNNVTLTITGAGIGRLAVEEVAPLISEFNFTYNAATPAEAVTRPENYATGNLRLARQMKLLGVSARAEFPLTTEAVHLDHLRRLYENLADARIDKLLVMRQFPVGRGELYPEHVPSAAEYLSAIVILRQLEAEFGAPKVKLQCALRFLEVHAGLAPPLESNPCDLGRVSYGLAADGTLLASPWVLNIHGRPLDQAWIIGNLAATRLVDLLATKKAQAFIARADENPGRCKVFSYLNSRRADPFERIFDNADPLYDPAATPMLNAAE
jgi:MoaA/NifB/PqqE/SkfB family radical SAM enzyme